MNETKKGVSLLQGHSSFQSNAYQTHRETLSLFGDSGELAHRWAKIARYDVNSLTSSIGSPVETLPDLYQFYGGLNLTQKDPTKRPILMRDHEMGINFLRFDALRADFFRTKLAFDPSPYEVTILVLARIHEKVPFDIDDDGLIDAQMRQTVQNNSLLQLGSSRLKLYRDSERNINELEAKTNQAISRWRLEVQDSDWKLYSVTFGGNGGEAIFSDTRIQSHYTSGSDSLRMTSSGRIGLGYLENGKGHLDADIAQVTILKERPSILDLRNFSKEIIGDVLSPSANLESGSSFAVSGGHRIRSSGASLSTTSSITTKATTDLGDLDNVQAWYSSLDSHFSGLSDGDTIKTWQDGSPSDHDMSMNPNPSEQAIYRESLYNGRPAIEFPSSAVGSVIDSKLDHTPYTIVLVGKPPRDGSSKCFFEIGTTSLQLVMSQSSVDRTKNDLEVRVNPTLMSERKAVFNEAVTRGEFFELVVMGIDPVNDPYELEVQIDGQTLVPDYQDTLIHVGSPMGVIINGGTIYPNVNDDEITSGFPHGSLQYIAADLFYDENKDRNFRIEKDGLVRVGDGRQAAYAQIAWYSRVLTPDELAFIRMWLDNHYPSS